MPADRLLGTLLRSLQTIAEQQDTGRLLGTAASLLTTLNNPLNVTLLTSQLLSAPAIWARPEGLKTCMRCLSVFHSAAQALIRHERALQERHADHDFERLQLERTLPKDDWIRAVLAGADNHSPRWRHLLVLGGLLLGFGNADDENLSPSMRGTLESGLVVAVNAALEEAHHADELGQVCLSAVLNHCFPTLSDYERDRLDYESLLPVLMRSTLHSQEGLRSAYFLGAIDMDVTPISKTQFRWPERCASFQQIRNIASSTLVGSLGPLSRLIAHIVENVSDSWLVVAAVDDLEIFARIVYLQWRQNKLSEVDNAEEQAYLDTETLRTTAPILWKLLRSTLFAVVIVLRSVAGRILGDPFLASDDAAPRLAAQTLRILRYLYFISARQGSFSFSQYAFVNLTALDILSAYPAASEVFLQEIRPAEAGTVPQHPLDRSLDLFFLNTAEHFTLVLPEHTMEELLIPSASPYLAAGGSGHLLPIFEAAHSVMLASFSAPQNASLTSKHLPFYVDSLFRVFPGNISARQFRLAFKTLMRLTTPPETLSVTQPLLPATLLELLHERASSASTLPLPRDASLTGPVMHEAELPLSEQAVITLTVIDTLPQLPLGLLEEWLPLAANMVQRIGDVDVQEHCKEHFWMTMINGEMDPDRSQLCAGWWNTDGGREMLLFGSNPSPSRGYEMSGALPASESSSKL